MTSAETAAADLAAAISELGGSVALSSPGIVGLIETALVAAYRRSFEDGAVVRAEVDLERGVCVLLRTDEAGEEVAVPLQGDIARNAARAIRAAVAGRLSEVESDDVVREAEQRREELVDAIVEQRQGRVWLLRVGEHFALLPPEEQMVGEEPRLHQHIKVIVLEARRRAKDTVLVVSRSHPQLLQQLLAQEVPEIQNGQVVVKAIVREAGRRAKVAVAATRPDVDPRGACIGPRGVRHRAITAELGAEQVQIVEWSEDPATYVAQALAPATALGVSLDEETHTAHVTVPADQLSLAIGRGGENARLVARLTGWRIDIAAQPA